MTVREIKGRCAAVASNAVASNAEVQPPSGVSHAFDLVIVHYRARRGLLYTISVNVQAYRVSQGSHVLVGTSLK
jgi:hypothetical protein